MYIILAFIFLTMVVNSSSGQEVVLNELMAANVSILEDEDGDYPDWIEIHNRGTQYITLDGFYLSDDESLPTKWSFPSVTIFPNSFLIVFASGKDRSDIRPHTNFKISSTGETIVFSNNEGLILDRVETYNLDSDISMGRSLSSPDEWLLAAEPTPESENSAIGFTEVSTAPIFSFSGGLYSNGFSLTLSHMQGDAQIYYTMDGSIPDDSSLLYSIPVPISSTSVIRARAYRSGLLYSKVVTESYIFYQDGNLPVVSIVTDPANLWDDETGIYVLGNDPGDPPNFPGANYHQDWEKPVHFDLFEINGIDNLKLDGGIKICGGYSRTKPQKPLAIFARDKYEDDLINYPIFPEIPIDNYKSFILRCSGNDWGSTMMRDALMTGLVKNTDIDFQAYRPCRTYLNGVYWGIYNIREKLNEDYLERRRSIDPDNVDLLEMNATVIEGDAEHYTSMIQFIENNNMGYDSNYEYIKKQMYIDNFIDYQIAQIYFANTDWPNNNIKYWRSRDPVGKWRWMLYDTDFGFGLFASSKFNANTLSRLLDPVPTSSTPLWSTLILRGLMENENFRIQFINQFADRLNFDFHNDAVNAQIESIANVIAPEVVEHRDRWGHDISLWDDRIEQLHDFANNRVDCVRVHIMEEFNLSSQISLTLEIKPENTGEIQIEERIIENFPWEGIYFSDIPITLTAHPGSGYQFVRWEGIDNAGINPLDIELYEDVTITAIFELEPIEEIDIIITEINYNSHEDFDPEDWIEIFCNTEGGGDLADWIFMDSNDEHIFRFPENTVLDSGELLVISRDTSAFAEHFPLVENVIGNFDFGLSGGGELLRLYDPYFNMVDSLTYDDNDPWPTGADGEGMTLELVNPNYVNEHPYNWRLSIHLHGSPGIENWGIVQPDMAREPEPPPEFRLYPNYPNPFNPSTLIRYDLPAFVPVELSIFDISGRTISKLVDEYQGVGKHEVKFDATGLASGVYIYWIKAGNHTAYDKMILMK